jgi:hypothetical protein
MTDHPRQALALMVWNGDGLAGREDRVRAKEERTKVPGKTAQRGQRWRKRTPWRDTETYVAV